MKRLRQKTWCCFALITISVITFLIFFLVTYNRDPKEVAVAITKRNIARQGITECSSLRCVYSPQCTTKNESCCAYILKNLLVFLDGFFRNHQLPYVIIYGTLLGAVRNHTIIPWTRDIDVGYFNKTYLHLNEIRNELYENGYHLFEALGMSRLCIHKSSTNIKWLTTQFVPDKTPLVMGDISAYIDLYTAVERTSTTTWNISTYSIQANDVFLSPISFQKTAEIDELMFPTVDNIHDHLVYNYHDNYMTEIL